MRFKDRLIWMRFDISVQLMSKRLRDLEAVTVLYNVVSSVE